MERIGCREKLILLGFDLGREVRLRDRGREFGPKKPPSEVVVFPLFLFFINLFYINSVWLLGKEGK